MRTLFVCFLMSLSVPAFAQSSLGIAGATFSLNGTQDEAGKTRLGGDAAVNVAITEFHGFQGDLRFSDTAGGGIGMAAAHLYMAPRDSQKYGLFAQLSDVDGRSMMWGALGAEGMVSINQSTVIEARGGFGMSDVDGLDFIFAGVSFAHEVTPSLEIEASFDVADFDELALRATAYDVGLNVRYSPNGTPWGMHASVTHSGLAGSDGARGETRIGFGITLDLGTAGGAASRTRLFRKVDPVAPLLRRGLW